MDSDIKITPDNIGVLTDILFGDEKSMEDYSYLENLTKVYLFSKYEGRKKKSLELIRKYFNPWTEIYTLDKEGIIYTYLSVTKDKEVFLFVGKYSADNAILERVPDKEEIKTWSVK